MACRTGCRTKNHWSYAACLKDAGIKVAYCNSVNGWDATGQKKWDAELDAYRAATAEGIQPEGTTMKQIEKAKRISDKAGLPYRADC